MKEKNSPLNQVNSFKEDGLKFSDLERENTYISDFKKFQDFCEENCLKPDFISLNIYLHYLITIQQVKLSTFNRRLSGINYWLTVKYNQNQTLEQKREMKLIRELYNNETYVHLKAKREMPAANQEQVLYLINQYDTNNKTDIRKRAICLVNLITANLPSEMVRLKIKHFNLNDRFIKVTSKKQDKITEKSLTLECVETVKSYIEEYKLQPEDHFVGAVDKWGNYKDKQIHEDSYSQSIHNWLGFSPYILRKTQIVAMCNKGASLSTIVKQTGHKSYQTIIENYLSVNTSDIDKFL